MLHRGNITITGLEDINRHPTVSVRLENGNVWLTKHELARLFGVFIQTIDANMRSIFKSRILNESEAQSGGRYFSQFPHQHLLHEAVPRMGAQLLVRIQTAEGEAARSPCRVQRFGQPDIHFIQLSNRKYGYKQIADRKVDNGAEKTSAVRHPRTDGA